MIDCHSLFSFLIESKRNISKTRQTSITDDIRLVPFISSLFTPFIHTKLATILHQVSVVDVHEVPYLKARLQIYKQ